MCPCCDKGKSDSTLQLKIITIVLNTIPGHCENSAKLNLWIAVQMERGNRFVPTVSPATHPHRHLRILKKEATGQINPL